MINGLAYGIFTPHPKNPVIARFFKEIGWVDELRSGVRNVYKYVPMYTANSQPKFIEGDIFKSIIPLIGDRVGDKLTENQKQIIDLMVKNSAISAKKIAETIGLSVRKTEKNIKEPENPEKLKG